MCGQKTQANGRGKGTKEWDVIQTLPFAKVTIVSGVTDSL